MINTDFLLKRIKESGFRRGFIAQKLGIGVAALTNKIYNRSDFKVSEVKMLCELLNLSKSEREAIFFADEVA